MSYEVISTKFAKKWQYREHVFLSQLILTINITTINITLCILEKKIKSALIVDLHF